METFKGQLNDCKSMVNVALPDMSGVSGVSTPSTVSVTLPVKVATAELTVMVTRPLACHVTDGAMMPVVFFAGNRAVDAIGRVDGVQQDAIAPHQRAATIAMALSIAAAVVAAGLLLLERRRGALSIAFQILVLVAAMASALPIGWASRSSPIAGC